VKVTNGISSLHGLGCTNCVDALSARTLYLAAILPILDTITSAEYANDFTNAGYDQA
jgi:hypothetical protein